MTLPPWLTMQAKKAWTAATGTLVALVTGKLAEGGLDAVAALTWREWGAFGVLTGLSFLATFNAANTIAGKAPE